MSILFIAEDIITPFKFWHNGHLATGMHFRDELWGQVLVAPYQERQRFFQTIEALSAQDFAVMITASKHSYRGWVNLRSPLANSLLSQPAALVQPASSPQSALPKSASPKSVLPKSVPLGFIARAALFDWSLALQAV